LSNVNLSTFEVQSKTKGPVLFFGKIEPAPL